MHNPRAIQWAQLFELPHQPALPLQGRLRLAIVGAVLDGRLPAGAPLPSSRELARLLGLSRNTVTSAYLQLIDEDFLESRPRSGVFVARDAVPAGVAPDAGNFAGSTTNDSAPGAGAALMHDAATAGREAGTRPPRHAASEAAVTGAAAASIAAGAASAPRAGPRWATRVLRSLAGRPTLAKPDQWRRYPYPFVYGTHDPQLFPTEDFRECCSRSLARSQVPHWTPDFETDDVPDLIEQIRLRLLPKRGVFAAKEEVLMTVGAQQAYYLLAEALFDETTRVGLEEPGHPHARNSFSLRKPQWARAAVDAEGLVVAGLPAVDYLYVTPSHQSPTTATLSLQRRHALLALAAERDFVVIEDDYEAENLYAGAPMPALKSLDKTGRVIYVGSVSKSLSPALRLGYIVAPRALIDELRVLRHAMLRHPSAFLQHAYALFLSLGHHESHARRVNAAMQQRLAVAAAALREHLPGFDFALPQGGGSIWVHAPDWLDAAELSLAARGHGVLIEAGDVFFIEPPYPCPFFRLRLSSIASTEIAAGIRALGLAVGELAQARGEAREAVVPGPG